MPQRVGPMMEFYDKIVGPARLAHQGSCSLTGEARTVFSKFQKEELSDCRRHTLKAVTCRGLQGIPIQYGIQTDPGSVMTFGSRR